MEFRQLEAYVNVYELENFSKAAEKMFVSQPSISAYLTSLEKELGAQLIYRSAKDFIPTKAGAAFYRHAKDLISLRDNAVQSIKEISGSDTGGIDILASSVPAQFILPEIFGAFHKQYPNVVFNLQQADTLDAIQAVSSYKSEVGFVGGKIDNPNCTYQPFLSEKLVLIAPNEKKFLDIDTDNISEIIGGEYFVMRERGSGTRLWYEESLKSIGIVLDELKISAQLGDTQSIIQAVSNGLGVSIVSELAAKHYSDSKSVIIIDIHSLPKRNFYIVLNKSRIQTSVVDKFIAFVSSYYSNK